MKKLNIITLLLLWALGTALAQLPAVQQGDIKANDRRLEAEIPLSGENELCIASFNIRNLGNNQRSLKDFEAIVDFFNEADVVLLQEVGLGIFDQDAIVQADEQLRLNAIQGVLQAYLGHDWRVVQTHRASGAGRSMETCFLAHRLQAKGFSIHAKFENYIDLGPDRDMAVFCLELLRLGRVEEVYAASVHLSPKDPERGREMIAATNWLLQQQGRYSFIAGDFNWGYRRTSGVENYKGEAFVRQCHEQNRLCQLFYHLSYLGDAKENQLRTNMGFRVGGYFYDQFLLSPELSRRLAKNGKLQEDCGIYAFEASPYARKVVDYWYDKNMKGAEKFVKEAQLSDAESKAALREVRANLKRNAENFSTFILSDHRIIWARFKLF